ncbi:MAG TPA: hypothetical protein VNU01_09310 [Egibacteraceae bacterium]|nr:hypothetical protein [Egibacteraceae bacterium]
MRGNKTKLLVACALAGALAAPVGAAAQTTTDSASHPVKEHPGQDTREHRGEALSLDCKWFRHDGREGVGCRWTPSKARDFAAYRLVRGERGQEPVVVFETDDRHQTHALDATAARDRDYSYMVLVFDAAGEVIGHTNPVRVSTRGRPDRPRPPAALPAVPAL